MDAIQQLSNNKIRSKEYIMSNEEDEDDLNLENELFETNKEEIYKDSGSDSEGVENNYMSDNSVEE